MKLSVDRRSLSDATRAAAKFLPRMSSMAVLEHLELEAHSNQLMISATNLDAGRTVEVEADIETDGRILVPANFAQIAAKAQGETLTLKATESISISDGVSQWKLQLGTIEDYPEISHDTTDEAEIDSWAHIQAVATAAGGNKDRPILRGVQFGGGFAAATDSYRLAWTACDAPEALVPAYAIRNVDDVRTLGIGQSHAAAVLPDGLWWSRLIDGNFPKWQSLIPTSPEVSAIVSTEALTEAVSRAAIVAPVISKGTNRWQVITLEVGDGITVRAGDDYSEIVEADVEGEMTANFNVGYLTDALAPVDKATLRLTDPLKPLLVESDWWRALIMPVRQ